VASLKNFVCVYVEFVFNRVSALLSVITGKCKGLLSIILRELVVILPLFQSYDKLFQLLLSLWRCYVLGFSSVET